jgi:nucleoside-diphosphate kinase
METNITFTMIKPDAMENGHSGDILSLIQKSGFRVSALKLVHLTKPQAEIFYSIHKEKPFFEELVMFMTRSPIIVAVLKKNNAVEDFRKLIGSTNPKEARKGTVRKMFASSMGENAIHGSDSAENARIESSYFFAGNEIF